MSAYYSQFSRDDLTHWQGKDVCYSVIDDEDFDDEEDKLEEEEEDEPMSLETLGMSWRDFM